MLKANVKEKLKNNRWILLPLLIFILTLLLFQHVLLYAFVPSQSMEPYIPCGSIGLANRLSYSSSKPDFGDVVVIKTAEGVLIVKRVIGMPGDTVELSGGNVYVNGQAITENYLMGAVTYTDQTFVVPGDSYFVLGDNRNNSEDSRLWEQPYVSEHDIIGKWMCGFQFVHSENTEE